MRRADALVLCIVCAQCPVRSGELELGFCCDHVSALCGHDRVVAPYIHVFTATCCRLAYILWHGVLIWDKGVVRDGTAGYFLARLLPAGRAGAAAVVAFSALAAPVGTAQPARGCNIYEGYQYAAVGQQVHLR